MWCWFLQINFAKSTSNTNTSSPVQCVFFPCYLFCHNISMQIPQFGCNWSCVKPMGPDYKSQMCHRAVDQQRYRGRDQEFHCWTQTQKHGDNMKAVAVLLLVMCHLAVSHGRSSFSKNVNNTVVCRYNKCFFCSWNGSTFSTHITNDFVFTAWKCSAAPQLPTIVQIDAGHGKVVARDASYFVYMLCGTTWFKLGDCRLKHVTAGPAGIWGADTSNRVYKYVRGQFRVASGTYCCGKSHFIHIQSTHSKQSVLVD